MISPRLRSVLRYLAIAAAGFLLGYLIVALFIFPNDGVDDGVKVPAVVGMPYDEAVKRLAAIGLKGSLGESKVSATAPKSTVLSQRPAGGLDASRGSTVLLDISAGQQRATVPSIAGQAQDAAAAALASAGLALGQVTEQNADEPRGTVLELRPDAGQVVPAGTHVDLVISAGPALLAMPEVIGRELSEARLILEQLGVEVAPVEYDSTSSLPRGSVISQSPSAGSSIPPGTAVVLRVAGRP
ncbi:MAG: PASTA domain-containing protein [Gemmatimonadaceae bacterium]